MDNSVGTVTPLVPFPKQELTLEQAFRVLDERHEASKGSRIKEWAKTQARNTPTSVAPFQDRVKFLAYAISLCGNRQPRFTALLQIRLFMAGHPDLTGMSKLQANKFVAKQLTAIMKRLVRPEQIDALEKEAIDFVQQEIRRTKSTMLPLVQAA